MATFIKGDAVANATSYELYRKVTPTGEISTATYSEVGYVMASNGELTGASSTWVHSDFIPLTELANNADDICVSEFISHGTVAAVAYYSEADFGAWETSLTFAQVGGATATAEKIISNAPQDAKYVVFSTDGSKATLNVTTQKSGGETTYTLVDTQAEINFDLDDLSAGSGTYVVKAKADGYEDSDYSNEVVYTE